MKTLADLPRRLNKTNIDDAIADYKAMLNEIPLQITASSLLGLLSKLKRENVGSGPYPQVSIFESANRIMTDLVILFGVRSLLRGSVPQLDFEEYLVEFGTENQNPHDITAESPKALLRGEAFNVAESFFQVKKGKSLRKLREGGSDSDYLLILYNADAVSPNYRPQGSERECFLPVELPL